jgi:predicted enzyme related to lactoylglutathione lyase
MVKDVAFIAYAVRDVPKAAAFYRDVLGLKPGETFNEDFVEFDVGSTAFALDAQPPGYAPGTCNGMNFEVDDVAAMRRRLVENTVEVTDVYEFPTCSICFAKDPDGNGFALHQRRANR